MDVKELKRSYYKIITDIWALYREDLATVQDIKSADDPRWANICDRYEKLVAAAPAGLRDYADSLMRVNIYELEKLWRFKDEHKLDDKTRPMMASSV